MAAGDVLPLSFAEAQLISEERKDRIITGLAQALIAASPDLANYPPELAEEVAIRSGFDFDTCHGSLPTGTLLPAVS